MGLNGRTCWLRVVGVLRHRTLLARHEDQRGGDRCTEQLECVLMFKHYQQLVADNIGACQPGGPEAALEPP